MVIAFAIPKMHPITAVYSNNLTGIGTIILEQSVMLLETGSQSNILHGSQPDVYITMKWGDLPDDELGISELRPGRCDVTISNKVNPESVSFLKDYDPSLVMIHELGHCFGLEHSPNPHDIMYYASIPEMQISEDSVVRFFDSLAKIRGAK
jgi:hypothetical protein